MTSADASYYISEIKKYNSEIEIEFIKVKSHSGEKYNEICDKLAKNELKSLNQMNGVLEVLDLLMTILQKL